MEQQRKTVQDLETIIDRCFGESVQAGHLIKISGKSLNLDDGTVVENSKGNLTIVVNKDEFLRHVSMTIIGELHELEIVRKMAPMFRQFRSLERDMEYVEQREAAASSLLSLRIGQK